MDGYAARGRFVRWVVAVVVLGAASLSLVGAAIAQANTLLVTKNHDYMGAVTSAPAGITCGTGCSSDSADYAPGTHVTLTANSATYYSFDHWTGSCSGDSTTCTLTMDANKWANAVYTCNDRLAGHTFQDFVPTPFTKDTYAAEGSPGANYGSNNHMRVGANMSGDRWYTYVKGPLPPVPQGCTPYAADLVLSDATPGPVGVVGLTINPVASSWSDDWLTWNNRPNATGYGFSSLYGYGDGDAAASVHPGDVQAMYDGSQPNYGFVVKPDGVGAGYSWMFDSIEGGGTGGMMVAWR